MHPSSLRRTAASALAFVVAICPQIALIAPFAFLALLLPSPAYAANPTSNAGADQTFAYSTLPKLVTLSGSGTDPDGGAITAYSWTTVDVPPGSAAALSSATAQNPTFTADLPGTYRFCLRVTDVAAETNGTDFTVQPTAACTNVMITTQHATLVLPAKGQRNTWDLVNAWGTHLDDLRGDEEAFEAEIAKTTNGDEGAAEVGTDTKTNLNNATTVEVALTHLNTTLTTTGPYLPLAGGSTTPMTGTIYSTQASLGLRGADGAAATVGVVGAVRAGDGGAASAGAIGGAGGAGSLTAGTGGAASATFAAGAGGAVSATAGAGGASNAANAAGGGGTAALTAGAGGVASANVVGGTGGATTIAGGAGGAGSAAQLGGAGGNLVLRAGAGGATGGAGAGANGALQLGTTNTASIAIAASGVITSVAGTLDVKNVTTTPDNTNDIGAAAAAFNNVYTRDVTSSAALTINAAPGSNPITVTTGAGAASGGAGPGGTGGLATVQAGAGGNGSGAHAGGEGGGVTILGGMGGNGTAGAVAGSGGTILIRGGGVGTDGGGGAGTEGQIFIGDSLTSAVNIGATGITTDINGTTRTDNIVNGTDNTYDIGDATNNYQRLHARNVRANNNFLLDAGTPGTGVAGRNITVTTGQGGVASGAGTVGGAGGALAIGAGTGGAGSGTDNPGVGGNGSLAAGRGGAGTATQAGARGGDLAINAGQGGATGGAGAGASGDINIGTGYAGTVTVGNATSVTSVAGSLAFSGITHTALPLPIATSINAAPVTAIGAAQDFTLWMVPAIGTYTNVHCYGFCATTDGDATDVAFLFRNNADGATAKTLTVPDAECGNTTGTYVRFDEVFLLSDFGGETGGKVRVQSTNGANLGEVRGFQCVVR